MKHTINNIGNSGIRNAIIHIRKMQVDNPIPFYIKPVGGTWFLGSVIIEDAAPYWFEWCIAVEPNKEPVFWYGADSQQHIDVAEYIKWLKYLIDSGGLF
jgi:hypothetical protein